MVIAHLSDLHLGQSVARRRAAVAMVSALRGVDHVVITGDVTHTGTRAELELFYEVMEPLRGRMTVVPGNHDRCGDDVAEQLTNGRRVWIERRAGLHLVCVDSTAPHNRRPFRAHGQVCVRALEEIDAALEDAAEGALTALLLHHHPVPLPVENLGEWFAHQFGWPHAAELPLGRRLLQLALGRCDLVLHGHRHVPRQFEAEAANGRILKVSNAGSTTELGACRVFEVSADRCTGGRWVTAGRAPRALSLEAVALPSLA